MVTWARNKRSVRSIKEECLNRMIFVGQALLRRAVSDYVEHYHEERNLQGLKNRLPRSPPEAKGNTGAISGHTQLGGVLNYYYLSPGGVTHSYAFLDNTRLFRRQ